MRLDASKVTQVLALIGDGSIKDGGGGMIEGIKRIYIAGVQHGYQLALEGKDLSSIDSIKLPKFLL